jgi:metal-dependent amidase/aminoacylase/carboxypeptidase family protein
VRTPLLDVWERLPDLIRSEIDELIAGTDATMTLDYTHGVPPVVNDPVVTETVRRAALATVGPEALAAVEQSWGGDDFAWFTREIPGTYARLGVRDPDGPTLDLHAGLFDVDERAIGIGVRLLVETVRQHFALPVP